MPDQELRELAMAAITFFTALSACALTVLTVDWFTNRKRK